MTTVYTIESAMYFVLPSNNEYLKGQSHEKGHDVLI
jgi:hypothetical protein